MKRASPPSNKINKWLSQLSTLSVPCDFTVHNLKQLFPNLIVITICWPIFRELTAEEHQNDDFRESLNLDETDEFVQRDVLLNIAMIDGDAFDLLETSETGFLQFENQLTAVAINKCKVNSVYKQKKQKFVKINKYGEFPSVYQTHPSESERNLFEKYEFIKHPEESLVIDAFLVLFCSLKDSYDIEAADLYNEDVQALINTFILHMSEDEGLLFTLPSVSESSNDHLDSDLNLFPIVPGIPNFLKNLLLK